MSDLLLEYRAAREKIDAAADAIFERRRDDVACSKGCSSCCVSGLTVLSVEAAAIAAHLEESGLSRAPSPPPGGCAFLDEGGACTIYDARPVVCRTHGLPLRMAERASAGASARGQLRVLDDVEVCALNFKERAYESGDVLDAGRVAALLLVVEQRYRAAAGLLRPMARVPLASLVHGD